MLHTSHFRLVPCRHSAGSYVLEQRKRRKLFALLGHTFYRWEYQVVATYSLCSDTNTLEVHLRDALDFDMGVIALNTANAVRFMHETGAVGVPTLRYSHATACAFVEHEGYEGLADKVAQL